MKGQVKWFSEEKGYGFLVDENGDDRFFGVRSISGIDLPKARDDVEFEPYDGKKGPAARAVIITHSAVAATGEGRRDDRVQCDKCGKRCVPRLWHNRGGSDWISLMFNDSIEHICPFCGVLMYTSGGGVSWVGKATLCGVPVFLFLLVISNA